MPEQLHIPDRSYDLLLFDLDGTLCDPIAGITACLNYALTGCGFDPVDRHQVAPFIGPPLDVTFESLVGSNSRSLIDRLIATYRERYSDIGYSECYLYPGVAEALRELHSSAKPLAVCTCKRKDFAVRILRMFGLAELFRFVSGGEVRYPKWQQLGHLRENGSVPPGSIMIGDRAVDLVAAHRNGLDSAGVVWGYGSEDELRVECPRYIFRSPEGWLKLIDGQDGFTGAIESDTVVPLNVG